MKSHLLYVKDLEKWKIETLWFTFNKEGQQLFALVVRELFLKMKKNPSKCYTKVEIVIVVETL